MEHASLLAEIRKRTGLAQDPEAQRLLTSTLQALGSALMLQDRERWASYLPTSLQQALLQAEYAGPLAAHAIYARVRATEGGFSGVAIEHAQAVISALAEALDADDRALLARHLPDEIAALVRQPDKAHAVHAPHPRTPAPERVNAETNLGAARPGSRHPLAEAVPGRAQPGSVADWDESRTAQSLATAHEERAADTLAAGAAGSTRGLRTSKG